MRAFALLILHQLPTQATAALISVGEGLLYDPALDVTWLQDASLGGRRSWADAVLWASELEFAGFDDWRLPEVDAIGTPVSRAFSNNATTDRGYARTTTGASDGGWRDAEGRPRSELGHMFYVNLAGRARCTPDDTAPVSCAVRDDFGVQGVGPVLGLTSNAVFWSGTLTPNGLSAFRFQFAVGLQDFSPSQRDDILFGAWAVRDGDVRGPTPPAPPELPPSEAIGVPATPSLPLLVAGLLWLLGRAGRFRRAGA